MKKIGFSIGGLSFLIPALAFAQTSDGLVGLFGQILDIINAFIPVVIALAFVYFLWAVAQYVLHLGDDQDKVRDQMLWGVITLFVMVAAWGLVNILADTFGVTQGESFTEIPTVGR